MDELHCSLDKDTDDSELQTQTTTVYMHIIFWSQNVCQLRNFMVSAAVTGQKNCNEKKILKYF